MLESKSVIFTLYILIVCLPFNLNAQTNNENGFHWSIEKQDSVYQLESITLPKFISKNQYQGCFWFERQFFRFLKIKSYKKEKNESFDKVNIFQDHNYWSIEIYFDDESRLLSHYFGLIQHLDKELKSFDKNHFYELNLENRVHAIGKSWTFYEGDIQKNILVYIDFSYLPSISQIEANEWRVKDNAKIILKTFEL